MDFCLFKNSLFFQFYSTVHKAAEENTNMEDGSDEWLDVDAEMSTDDDNDETTTKKNDKDSDNDNDSDKDRDKDNDNDTIIGQPANKDDNTDEETVSVTSSNNLVYSSKFAAKLVQQGSKKGQ